MKFPYDKKIENALREGISKGLSPNAIYENISHWQNCPSRAAMYKKYSSVIAEAQVEYQQYILGLAHSRMEEGSDRLIELALKSKVDGFNPTAKLEADVSVDEESKSAIDTLANLLGVDTPKDED